MAACEAPIRVGIIGLGRAGWGMHRPELKACGGFEIVAGCDLVPARVAKLEAEEPGAKGYHDYYELLADPRVQLVATATRSNTHAQVVTAALRAGKHVVAEKPFACSVAEADEIVEAAARSTGRLFVRHNRRWDADFLAIKDVLATGKLGQVYHARLCRHGYQRRNDWQTLKAFRGGQLNNWGPHIIDHALRLIDAPIVDVWSDLRNIAGAGDAEDHLKIVLRGANGMTAEVEISGGVALAGPVWHILGDQGALQSDGRVIKLRWYDRASMKPVAADPGDPPVEGGFGNAEQIPWQEQIIEVPPAATEFYKEVFRALTTDGPYDVTLEQARAVVEVTEWARAGTGF